MSKYYTVSKKKIDSNGRKIKLLILTPKAKTDKKPPCVLWLHGGGYATGMAEMVYFTRARALAKKYGAVVVAPSYTLSIKAPYPAAIEDCYASLKFIKENSCELGINKNQIMVGGESAGGGLCAALCMMAKDRGEVNIACQMPLYPMLDNRDTESSKDNHAPVWNTKRNHKAWSLYLKGVESVCEYASPARREDYSMLPPVYTFVGDIEPFYCETLEYAENLKKAGVDAVVDVYKDWYHAYDLYFPFTKKAKKAINNFEKWFIYAKENYFACNEQKF